MSTALYLHETVDIIGQGAVPYMERSVVGFDAEQTADRGLTLFGTWYVQGSTGRWPQVINLWELIDGWEGWRRLCASTNLQRESNESLRSWWEEAYRYRSGGFDRLLQAAPGSPTLAELSARELRGRLFVHELSRVRPGTALEYLAALRDEQIPLRRQFGHEPIGFWQVLMSDTEVCTIWLTDLDSHIAWLSSDDERIQRWRERARKTCTDWREEMMVACPGTPLGPERWDP